jgi:hypothetical protein
LNQVLCILFKLSTETNLRGENFSARDRKKRISHFRLEEPVHPILSSTLPRDNREKKENEFFFNFKSKPIEDRNEFFFQTEKVKMSAARAQPNPFDDYEYLNENSIDAELKCALCMSPFQSPTSGACGHTFCQGCVQGWVARQSTCPTCRIRTSTEDFRPISTRIVINLLDRLLVRCKRCDQTNIPRGDVNEHEKRCPNQTISCPAFDIKCPWKGTQNALTAHLEECPFQKMRPVIEDLYEQSKKRDEPLLAELQTVRQQLEKQRLQNRFLLSVFNNGKPMTERCSGQHGSCQLQQMSQYHNNIQYVSQVSLGVRNLQEKVFLGTL